METTFVESDSPTVELNAKICGALVAIAVLISAIVLCLWRRKKQSSDKAQSNQSSGDRRIPNSAKDQTSEEPAEE
ncbi:unnamed protein product, partial [Soboliphyme baturini]|uniref:Cell surface glycoprotein 1 n=1 Tax=Soboliphyme baturini TaxID=241478 RepID=A0A183IWC1_9BILA